MSEYATVKLQKKDVCLQGGNGFTNGTFHCTFSLPEFRNGASPEFDRNWPSNGHFDVGDVDDGGEIWEVEAVVALDVAVVVEVDPLALSAEAIVFVRIVSSAVQGALVMSIYSVGAKYHNPHKFKSTKCLNHILFALV